MYVYVCIHAIESMERVEGRKGADVARTLQCTHFARAPLNIRSLFIAPLSISYGTSNCESPGTTNYQSPAAGSTFSFRGGMHCNRGGVIFMSNHRCDSKIIDSPAVWGVLQWEGQEIF
jgi:hypothetical protein